MSGNAGCRSLCACLVGERSARCARPLELLRLLSCDCTQAVELGFKSLFLRLADKRSLTRGAASSCQAPGTSAWLQAACSWGLGLPWGSPSFPFCRTAKKMVFYNSPPLCVTPLSVACFSSLPILDLSPRSITRGGQLGRDRAAGKK